MIPIRRASSNIAASARADDIRTERIFLLVGAAALFAGYDMNIFGLATPQIQASLHIPENQVGPDRRLFPPRRRLRHDAGGQRRSGGTPAAAAGHDFRPGDFHPADRLRAPTMPFVWAQFFTRVFGYAEEMLCSW